MKSHDAKLGDPWETGTLNMLNPMGLLLNKINRMYVWKIFSSWTNHDEIIK